MTVPYAHRGLHGPGVPENSLAAFAAAAQRGMGVELDVRLSADGVLVVHHDSTVQRMCGLPGRVADVPARGLTRLRLAGTDERVPTLAVALRAVDGAVPLLVDAKVGVHPGERARLVDALAILVRVYRGPVAVVSFDPLLLAAFAARAPRVPRGQSAGVDPVALRGRWWLRMACHPFDALWSLRLSKPHFLSFNVDRLPSAAAAQWRRLRPVVAWTVRTAEQHHLARRHADGVVVEDAAVDLALAERRRPTLPVTYPGEKRVLHPWQVARLVDLLG